MADATATVPLRRAVRGGVLGGLTGIYVAGIGLTERLNGRNAITEVITLGYLMYVIIGLAVGYVASRKKLTFEDPVPPTTASVIRAGAVAGLVSGLVMVPFIFLIGKFEVRDTFVNISENLYNILTLERGTGFAVVLFPLVGLVLGALGASIHLLGPRTRRPLLAGLGAVLFMTLMEPLIRVMLSDINDNVFLKINLDIPPDWLYESEGLTIIGTVVVFVIAAAIAFRGVQKAERKAAEGEPAEPTILQAEQATTRRKISIALLIVGLMILPQVVGSFPSEIIGVVGVYILLGLGLNIVVGYAGMLDLGYVAFYAIGAYSVGILTSPASPLIAPEMSFWLALPLVLLITTLSGVVIGAPVLRLRGDYLAIVTLGFGEIIRVIVQSDWAAPLLGGAQGLLRVPAPSIFGFELRDPQSIYYLILACVLLVAFVAYRVKRSRVGRAWNALREDEQVAEAMGISIIKTKLLAFGLGAALASFGGMIFAAKIGSLFPNTFTLLVSINVLAIIVLGGMGSIPGVVVGAFVLVGIPEVLREFGEYRLLFYGIVLMTIMITRPEGVLPDVRRRRELHEAEDEDEQYLHRAGAESGAPVIVPAGGEGSPA
jgi:branched-chain amino acid transport system permease protein